MRRRIALVLVALALLAGCAAAPPEGTGDLGVVIERARGTLAVVNTTRRELLAEVAGLGDLSHASVVYARDGARAYVFGRDGGLTRVNLLTRHIEARIMQAGNSIGGAISQDGRLVAAQNYQPGGIKVFDAETLALVADIPAEYAPGQRSRVVGLAELPGRRFIYSLFDADQIWIADLADPQAPKLTKFDNVGRQPYDALLTPDGRYYIAGLFGEDGLSLIDLWAEQPRTRKILSGYGRGTQALPVFKMPHLRGWAVAGRHAYLPAIGRHEVLVVDTESWAEVARIPVAGQPVFVMARPDGRQVWVNFAVPDYHQVQVIDTQTRQIVRTLEPGKAVLHMEFTPKGEAVWISARDANRVVIVDTASFATLGTLTLDAPSGIFFTSRAARLGLEGRHDMDAATGFVETQRSAWMLALLNDWQRDFPLDDAPFSVIARRYGISEDEVLQGYRAHAQAGAVSRIGGVWAAGAGGAALLCAMSVPEERLSEVARLVSAHPGVNHNYEREHAYNLWFVITGRGPAAVESGVAALEAASGLRALRLPMQRVYRIDLGFDLHSRGRAGDTQRACPAAVRAQPVPAVRDADRPLAALVEAGLPLAPRPYAQWARSLGLDSAAVLTTLRGWLEQGTLRRFGVVVRHHEVGYDQNAMTVINVPDAQVDACAAVLARQPGVTLCYRRARADGWPYNLYCMVHGRARDEVRTQITQALDASGLQAFPHLVLFSRQRFKQAGARYFRDQAGAAHVAG